LASEAVKKDRGFEAQSPDLRLTRTTRSFHIEAKSDAVAHTGPTKSGISTYPQPHLGKSQFISGQFSD